MLSGRPGACAGSASWVKKAASQMTGGRNMRRVPQIGMFGKTDRPATIERGATEKSAGAKESPWWGEGPRLELDT